MPSQVELTPLQLATPNGVPASSVGAEITLQAYGGVLVGTNISTGGSRPFGVGQVAAMVNANFYSTTDQPLPAGTYTATTTLSMVAQ